MKLFSLLALRTLGLLTALAMSATQISAQEMPISGVTGYDYFYATTPSGVSQFYATNANIASAPFVFGTPVNAVPSRWSHRRRTLQALETATLNPNRGVFITPMGDAVGNGALHLVDLRSGVQTALVHTGNPAGYDVCAVARLKFVFAAEDSGAGTTVLRGYSYQTPGALVPLNPPALVLFGSPSAYVQRIGVDSTELTLHVPTAEGVHIVQLNPIGLQMLATSFLATAPASATTNPVSFMRGGVRTWAIGTANFNGANPSSAGVFAWNTNGTVGSSNFGIVPTVPSKNWVPAVGTEELAVVSNGTDAYTYFLLREPGPGTFFVKASALGVVKFLGFAAPATSTIVLADGVGEPFSVPSVSGNRVAFESSFGPPFVGNPPGGGERINILYSPLDPLGASSPNGVVGVPAPLGGRISCKGLDRPIWTADGTRVMAATSHFPGAPNPSVPGLEVLNVPADVLVDEFTSPHTVVQNLPFPNQSILLPGTFLPRVPAAVVSLAGISFYGTAFHHGLASIAAIGFGEVGQLQTEAVAFVQSTAIPDFPAILPPSFLDAAGSLVPVPLNFGARRTAFNYAPGFGPDGLTMSAAIDSEIIVEKTSTNYRAAVGVGVPAVNVRVQLPAGSITTTEIVSY